MLIKGALLFIAFGFLFLIAVLGVEYFLWLNSTGRLLLFLLGIGIITYLLIKYICIPLFYLFKLKKGLSNKDASVLIGKHFPEVGDKLYNLLDLEEDPNKSELLVASIEQRSKNLQPIPFVNAVTFKDGFKYIKYAVIPLVIILVIDLTGNLKSYFDSYKRVVNYDLAYEPPAPFSFHLLSTNLTVLENQDFTIKVNVVGKIRPDEVYIVVDGKEMLLQENNGEYEYTLNAPLVSNTFYFTGNEVTSKAYSLIALKTPGIEKFKMILDYPNYTGLSNEIIESTGNASFPEGTKVSWNIIGKNTDAIHMNTKDSTYIFNKNENKHTLSERIYKDTKYSLTTSNKNIADFEKLIYTFKVVKDASPTITVNRIKDSLNPNISYFVGNATDDYKLKELKVVCYEKSQQNTSQSVVLEEFNTNYSQFYYTFPSGFSLEKGKEYSLYFEVTDNDALHNGKTTKSEVFNFGLLEDNELKNKELESQKSLINNLDKSLENAKEQKQSLKEINNNHKEKENLNYNEKRNIQDFLEKQQEQESLMQKFSKELKENLNKQDKDSEKNKLLQERLERQELQAKKNQKLLEDLKKVANKINKEDLSKKLEDIAKKQKNSERNLEQLLELTKRYYVTEKLNQLSKDLKDLSEKQEKLSNNNNEEKALEEQLKLNKEFQEISKDLEELQKDNQDLKKPLDLETNPEKQDAITNDQQDAKVSLEQKNQQASKEGKDKESKKASSKQKSAAQKMKELSEAMEQSSSASSDSSSVAEDAEMLRQILDNLITFSFKQEALYKKMNIQDADANVFGNNIKEQQQLRLLFEHVDDSLFALSLRREELSEFVNEQITEVYYNVDKALENVADGRLYQGASNQKYVITAANSLSDFLVNILDNMQQSMQMGKGEGDSQQGFQLPDIIKSQGDLKKKMDGSGKPGQGNPGGKSGQGKSGSDGEKGKEGSKPGSENGSTSNNGKNGTEGKNGKGNKGKNGEGEGGQGEGNGSSSGDGLNESELKEIYEIYKSQQTIRRALEEQLSNMINEGDRELGKKLIQQMQDFENDLLENGITKRTTTKSIVIQYELLKLENAALKKGKKSERESNSNKNTFVNPILTKPSLLEDYHNETEILNKQSLPLRHIFKNRVKLYFKSND
ncbi:hypothetical protein CLV91_0885 [Maribacter vaceletii]|uniref:Uncharacterized protein n=1 Tax=Maribacter vaceletii TaxID=1206816 RepID=A0A495EDC3_9FLAO|nr:hypothetical protein [Maribacter vaceletii]RKR14806.1 hypothetical protein CLV91_0885 [Maribacter vaceletii]